MLVLSHALGFFVLLTAAVTLRGEDKGYQKLHQKMDGAPWDNSFDQQNSGSDMDAGALKLDGPVPPETNFQSSEFSEVPQTPTGEHRDLMASPAVERAVTEPPSPSIVKNFKKMDAADVGVMATGSIYGVNFLAGGLTGVITGALIGIGAAALLYLSFVKPLFNPIGRLRQYLASKNKPGADKESKTNQAPAADTGRQT
ncbi:MAG: hypothetical protein HY547_09010 [Elusimicrobia bacterium]|nr:hypothetical protein [Elusimicrobiota bacterium]